MSIEVKQLIVKSNVQQSNSESSKEEGCAGDEKKPMSVEKLRELFQEHFQEMKER